MIITGLSLTPMPELPEWSPSDKLHHLVAYAVLAAFACMSRRSSLTASATMISIILYGGLIELIQPFVNRHGDMLDFFANGAGVFIGVGTMLILSWLGLILRQCRRTAC